MTIINKLLILAVAALLPVSGIAQTATPQSGIKLFFEKVFVHTDRAVYAAGEDIWYKAYLINGQDNHLTSSSKNLYVQLISPVGDIVNKQIIHIANGTGKGDFALAGALVAGNYTLRAFTNWQRNFGDNFIFEKHIVVTSIAAVSKSTGKTLAKNTEKGALANGTNTGVPVIRFYPEGGSMLNEVSAIVAVRAEDDAGKGISLTGPVISSTGDTVTRFTCDSAGLGEFAILPLAGQSYHTKITYRGQVVSAQLPAALNSGLNLKVVKRDTLIAITISCNTAGVSTFAGKNLSLVVKHAGVSYIDQQLQLTGNAASIKVAESILPEGIAAITIYDDQHKPYSERLIYVDHKSRQARLTVNTNKSIYKSRERVNVSIRATDANQHAVAGDFSLAAIDAGVDKTAADNIVAYLKLQSEIIGKIDDAERYFDTTNVNRAKQLDLLLLTQGWRDFVWRRLADTSIKISYLPEQGFTLTGTVKKENNNTGIANTNVTLSIPKARDQKLFATQTNQNGGYFFDNLQLNGQQLVTITTRDDKGKANGEIRLDSLSANELPVVNKPFVAAPVSNDLAGQMEKRASANKLLDTITNLSEVKVNANRNVRLHDQDATPSGYADEVLTVNDKDLKDFKTLREYILYASKQAKNNLDNIVFYADGKTYTPRIIVNNREEAFTNDDLNDASVQNHYYTIYYELPLEKVEKVVIKRLINNLKVPNSARTLGNTPASITGLTTTVGGRNPGVNFLFVIYLTLKPGALLQNGGGVTSSIIQGYYEARSFYKPLHGTNDLPKPDLRNTIHWEPVIKTDASGNASISFYNADPKTDIRIVIQGVTATGEPLNAVKGYSVR